MPTVQQDVAAIRTAVYGRDVREAIADGIEHCYNDAEGGIQRANTAADNADTAAQNVNAAIQNANTATGAANAAANAANTAAQNANTAAQDTTEAVQNGIQRFQEELDRKARTDGYYQDLTAGNAEQLISTQFVEDKALYTMRKAGGSADVEGREYLDKIIGGTVAWNQIVPDANKAVKNTSTTDTRTYLDLKIRQPSSPYTNVFAQVISTTGDFAEIFASSSTISNYQIIHNGASSNIIIVPGVNVSIINGHKYLFTMKVNGCDVQTINGIDLDNINLFDLTQMFGTTIADYIYSLEQAHVGDGVAFFRKLFPASYYPYNAGELVSVNALSHDTVGFNQWDEEWVNNGYYNGSGVWTSGSYLSSKNPIKVVPSSQYYISNSSFGGITFWDADMNFISRYNTNAQIFTTPSNCRFIHFNMVGNYGTTYKNDICINLSDPARNGEYEPYEKHTYPMDSDLELHGMVKLDEDNQLYYDGDEYTPDGTVNRRYGVVDLGTLNWSYQSTVGHLYFRANLVNPKRAEDGAHKAELVCSKYSNDTGNNIYNNVTDKTIAIPGDADRVMVYDTSYSDAATFKTAMSGVMLVYELATPTTEEADPFTNVQVIDGSSTEAFTTGTVMPVYAEARFPANLRDKLQHLPSLADGDGQYLIKQTGSDMKLIPDHKAEVDGYYPDMTVGTAEQLDTKVGVVDETPYVFRASAGHADIGDREEDMLVGGTVAWNQLIQNGNFANATGWNYSFCSLGINNNEATITKDGTNLAATLYRTQPFVVGHKVLVSVKAKGTAAKIRIRYPFQSSDLQLSSTFNSICKIGIVSSESGSDSRVMLQAVDSDAGAGNTLTVKDYNCFDLTQMFGSTIADYIYSLEQAHAGDGVAFFRKLFPKPYYEYNPGELISVNASAHKMVGFNQWDEEWEVGKYDLNTGLKIADAIRMRSANRIKIIAGTPYYHTCQYMIYAILYDGNGNYLYESDWPKDTIKTFPSEVHEIAFHANSGYGNTYHNDICINISDPSRNGEYEPYEENVYPLGDVELRGIPKLDANNKLVFDGDTYESDGTVTRKYGIVDLGTLNWGRLSDSRLTVGYIFESIQSGQVDKKMDSFNQICAKYTTAQYDGLTAVIANLGANVDNIMFVAGSQKFYIIDSKYNDASALKSALNGVYAVYELATPTTEESDPFVVNQKVSDYGTEEYIDRAVGAGDRDVSMIVGHHTLYQANLRAKLEMAPNSPDGDGDYVVRQTSGTNEYVPLASILAPKANADGTYDQMIVGNAKQLVSTIGIEDRVPYIFRTSGGSADIGDRENDKIVGGTVAWNQVINAGVTHNGVKASRNEDGSFTLSGTATGTYSNFLGTLYLNVGHRYICLTRIVANPNSLPILFNINNNVEARIHSSDGYICRMINNGSAGVGASGMTSGADYTGLKFYYSLFDITQMLGTAIADYIYSLEASHAGDGIAWFRKLFPKPYYAYNPGELLSVEGLQSHDMVGFNQWDEEWVLGKIDAANGIAGAGSNVITKNYIQLIPDTTYHITAMTITSALNCRTRFYDSNQNYLGYTQKNGNSVSWNANFTTPINAYYLKIEFPDNYGTTYKNDVCLNFAWDGERNGEYEPYTLHSYPLDSSLTLRGIPKLDSNNKLYYDGDTYEPDGTVTRRYGVVDLGTLNWTKVNSTPIRYTGVLPKSPKGNGNRVTTAPYGKYSGIAADKTLYLGEPGWYVGTVIVQDTTYDSSDAATFKAAMSGQYLVYELQTPETEQAEPYSDPQIVDDWGTEEYVTDSIVPVGHVTNYQPNLRAKLEMAPDSPEGDGDYIVRQSNGENTYVPLVIPNELPTIPTSNGTYVLKVTVANGTPTLSWVAE